MFISLCVENLFLKIIPISMCFVAPSFICTISLMLQIIHANHSSLLKLIFLHCRNQHTRYSLLFQITLWHHEGRHKAVLHFWFKPTMSYFTSNTIHVDLLIGEQVTPLLTLTSWPILPFPTSVCPATFHHPSNLGEKNLSSHFLVSCIQSISFTKI